MSFGKFVTLATGARLPQFGLGTWKSKPHEVENAVEIAVRNGYRHLDLARIYGNQNEVGAALKKVIPSVVKREDLFITSKLWNSSHQPSEVTKELELTLEQLGVDYLDLYLMHWPVAFAPGKGLFPPGPPNSNQVELDLQVSLVDTWTAMLGLPKSKVRAVGVSNFSIEHLKGIIAATGVVPTVNQIEAHPLLPQDELVAYCKEQNIHITAYSPLGNNHIGMPLLTENPVVKEVAKKLSATEAQVLVAWGAYRGYSVIPKSVNEDRIKSNFQQVELSKEDYEKISAVKGAKETRLNIPYRDTPSWDISIFNGLEDAKATNQVKIM
ncbi:Aldo/keto reductase [Gautieria morchelliformis]|nr:Aldo/keto reductase [Gautieria morchelliformis]